jgi:xanthine/CO dehydrogenase XdhC/CoxF family maturation factor
MVPAHTFAGAVAEHLACRRSVDLFTVVRSSQPHRFPVGAKVVCSDGVAPRTFGLEHALSRVLCAQLPQTDPGEGCCVRSIEIEAGLHLDLYCERLYPPLQCIVVGAGHIGVALAEMGHAAGWSMIVADDRSDYANPNLFAADVEVLCTPFEDVWDSVTMDEATAVVLVTRGHKHDESSLRSLVNRAAFYVGMIGSRRRVGRVKKHLREEQVSESWLKRLYAPIGLPIGADTPGEIALAIAAEITSVWRKRGVWAREQKEAYYKSK